MSVPPTRAGPEPPTPTPGSRSGSGGEPDEGSTLVLPSGSPPPDLSSPALRLAAAAPPGQRLGPYVLSGVLGRGGMGIVYRAHDPALGRDVAVKVVEPGAPPDVRARFLREARTGARLRHPGIVAVHAAGEADGQAYIVEELIAGRSLSAILAEQPLSPEQGARVVQKVARALAHAHANGVIHRDVKPGNILLDPQGEPHLADFGLAREVGGSGALSRSGVVLGTPQYMSPEQAEGRPGALDGRTDLWSCGVVLYECLTGTRPFGGETPLAVLAGVLAADPPPLRRFAPEAPRDLETIVGRCLEKSPTDRYATAEALAEDLGRFLAGEPVLARPVGPLERAVRRARRHRALVAVLGAAIAAVAGVTAFSAVREMRASARRDEDFLVARALTPTDPEQALAILDRLAAHAPGTEGLEEARAVASARRETLAVERLLREARAPLDQARSARGRIGALTEALRTLPGSGRVPATGSGLPAGAAAAGGEAAPGRAEAWQEREEQTVLARAGFEAVRSLLRGHPELAEFREAAEALGEIAWARLCEAEWEGDPQAARRYEKVLRDVAPERYTRELRGVGSLTLETDPPGAEVECLRYEDEEGLLVEQPFRLLGAAPLRRVLLPMGSYLLVIRKDGHRDTRYPVQIGRAEDHVVREPVSLLREEEIGPGYVYVPPGESILGGDPQAYDAWPRRREWVPGFCIGEREVTVGEYRRFLQVLLSEGSPSEAVLGRSPQPVRGGPEGWRIEDGIVRAGWPDAWPILAVPWSDAAAYCEWRSRTEGRPVRLPTEAEWERAARGADGRPHPWGDSFRWERVVGGRSPIHGGSLQPHPGGSATTDRSPFGVLDLAGSAREWCVDEIPGGLRPVRGGSWGSRDPNSFRAARRLAERGRDADIGDGFRVRAEPRRR
ncbi:MAG: SUMF1/EgtB/PvdO family nonheme iron enzyme [Planctomycetales bacterium]|nr:SUMF1/EgtB/PvdO family nonheme iron enzyme [Planctomycetales bacterium]